MNTQREKMHIVMDESWVLFDGIAGNDELREKLRAHPGVPNATYLAKDGQVFVFAKLVKLISAASKPDVSLGVLVKELYPQALMSPEEAVKEWSIVPWPYTLIPSGEGRFAIEHSYFRAVLPGTYASTDEALEVYAHLLRGEVIQGDGDFVYRGQPFKLREPVSPNVLPVRPVVEVAPPEKDCYLYAPLRHIAYEAGFAISETEFHTIKRAETQWAADRASARGFVSSHFDTFWANATRFPWQFLSVKFIDPKAVDLDDASSIFELYPELTFLPEGAVCAWHEAYRADFANYRGDVCREDDFLHFMLGQLACAQDTIEDVVECGEWAIFALLRGETFEDAFAFARQAARYHSVLTSLANRYARAIQFVASDKSKDPLQGPPVVTFMDTFRASRTGGFAPVLAKQDFSQLATLKDGELMEKRSEELDPPTPSTADSDVKPGELEVTCPDCHAGFLHTPEPIPMLLFCPQCALQHVDRKTETWDNPPHRSHKCHFCGCIWRPSDFATTGIGKLATKGELDVDLSTCVHVAFFKPGATPEGAD